MRGRSLAAGIVIAAALLPASAGAHVKSYETEATLETNVEGVTPGEVISSKGACEKSRKVVLSDPAGFLGDDTTNKRGEFRVPGIPSGDVSIEVKKRFVTRNPKHKHKCLGYLDEGIDVSGPEAAIDTPGDGVTTGPSGNIVYTVGDAATVSCTLDGTDLPCDLSGQAPFSSLANGDHTVTVTATDAVGNDTVSSVTWPVDALPPTITGFAVLGGSGTGGTVQAFLSDASTITEIRCVLDNAPETDCKAAPTLGQIGWDGLVQHTVVVYGIDQWGNSGASAPVTSTAGPHRSLVFDFSEP